MGQHNILLYLMTTPIRQCAAKGLMNVDLVPFKTNFLIKIVETRTRCNLKKKLCFLFMIMHAS